MAFLVFALVGALFAVVQATPTSAVTTVPTKMNFQGRLTNAANVTVPNGTYNMRLKLYTVDTVGTAVWAEDRLVSASQGVTITNGLFTIQLGSITTLPASLFASGALYLEIELPTPASATTSSPSWTEGAMTPRNQLATSAYAYNSETLDGLDSAAFGQTASANTWTGTNAFNGATLSVGGTVNTAKFNVGSIFNVDTSGSIVSVGTSDTTGTVLILDTKTTAGDPTGSSATNGAMYYNSNAGKFRCYQAGAWADCIGAGGGGSTTLQQAYDNSSSPATITTSSGTKGMSIKAGSTFDQTDLFTVQDSASVKLFTVDSQNGRVVIGNPTADGTATVLVLDTKNTVGDPTGTDGAMYYNSSLGQYRCYRDGTWEPCGTKPIDRAFIVEDEFLGGSTATGTIGQTGWNMTAITSNGAVTYNQPTGVTTSPDRPGILRLQTAATVNTGSTLMLGSATGGSMQISAGQVVKTAVAVGSATSGQQTIRVGIHNEVAVTTRPTTGVFWEADTSLNANWQYCHGTGSAVTCTPSSVAVTANTMVRLEIKVATVGTGTSAATFSINGIASNVSGATINSINRVSPAVSMYTQSATQNNFYIDYYQIRGDASAIR